MKNKETKALNDLLSKIELNITFKDTKNDLVSKSDVAWHLDHSLKVINAVVSTMQKTEPSTYKNNFNLLGRILLSLGYFPRGKAKAPKAVQPPNLILKEEIIAQLNEARGYLETINSLDKNAYFKHPMFGNINRPRVIRFLETHTKHHLKIINDILKA